MTTLGYVLLGAGLALFGVAVILIGRTLRAVVEQVNRQGQVIAQLERRVDEAKALARKRLVAGRSGR